jgi:hypothetical protein
MIGLSEMFSLVGDNNIADVATSLDSQGVDPEISIPIYDVFYLKIMASCNAKYFADNLQEFTMIRTLADKCGSVTATINLLDMDVLTIAGALMIATPNTGMNVFLKIGGTILDETVFNEDIADQLGEISGIPTNIIGQTCDLMQFIETAIEEMINKLIEAVSEDLERFNIHLMTWDQLPNLYATLKKTGELYEMENFRRMLGASTL